MLRPLCVLVVLLLGLASVVPGAAPPALDRHGDPLPAGAIARLGTSRFRTGGYTPGAQMSPDGRLIAVSVGQGFRLFDTTTGKEVRRIIQRASNDEAFT